METAQNLDPRSQTIFGRLAKWILFLTEDDPSNDDQTPSPPAPPVLPDLPDIFPEVTPIITPSIN
ncbi:MAG: hypothetical protein WCR01_13270 [Bacteroidota bacterium]